jgi:hypothetical protein
VFMRVQEGISTEISKSNARVHRTERRALSEKSPRAPDQSLYRTTNPRRHIVYSVAMVPKVACVLAAKRPMLVRR